MSTKVPAISKRPAEWAALPLITLPAYSFLLEAGVSRPLAGIVALAAGILPGLVSKIVDAINLNALHVGDVTTEPDEPLPEDHP